MKTPYAHVVNVSWQRQLPAGFVLEAYLGRFSRHTLQQIDLAQPLDLVDPKSGMDYFTAATELSKTYAYRARTFRKFLISRTCFPAPPADCRHAKYLQHLASLGNEPAALYALDILCYPNCGGPTTGRFWPTQFASMYTWASIGRPTTTVGNCYCVAPWAVPSRWS